MGSMTAGVGRSRASSASETGGALVVVLLTTVVLSGVALGLIALTNTEVTIASNHREARQLLYAAEAAAERAVSDLMRVASFDDVLSGVVTSVSRDFTLTPILPSRETLDLTAMTARLQAESDADARRGVDNPRWLLFVYHPFSLVARCADCAEYIVAWIADDAAEADGDPLVDSNHVMTVRARAVGRQGLQRTVEVVLAKRVAGVGILSWREVR
jgi:hypothetical protein